MSVKEFLFMLLFFSGCAVFSIVLTTIIWIMSFIFERKGQTDEV